MFLSFLSYRMAQRPLRFMRISILAFRFVQTVLRHTDVGHTSPGMRLSMETRSFIYLGLSFPVVILLPPFFEFSLAFQFLHHPCSALATRHYVFVHEA